MTDVPPAAASGADDRLQPASPLAPQLMLQLHDLMLTSRLLEERLIRMQKQGDSYFWIGGPGEEAFNTSLGLLVRKGRGLDYDFTHLHYRASAVYLAMGGEPTDVLRQMRMRATDPFSGGRNFVSHFSVREWNLCPVTSPIQVQFPIAIGTAMAQRKSGCRGITVVQGGDAGTAEGDFATSLVWSSRPEAELPILLIVMNNGWGISTAAHTQHGETNIADRAAPFGIRHAVVDGNDPVESYLELKSAMEYVREQRRPFLLEARVSRLYGHSSSSGANYVEGETDCLLEFEKRLEELGLRSAEEAGALRDKISRALQDAARAVRDEPEPTGESVTDHVFAEHDVVGEGVSPSHHPRTEEH